MYHRMDLKQCRCTTAWNSERTDYESVELQGETFIVERSFKGYNRDNF